MRLGAYPAVLHDKPLPEAFAVLRELGQTGAEIGSGGFPPAPRLPIADGIRAERAEREEREEYLGRFAEYGITLTALHCDGSPLHPDPEARVKHGQDARDGSRLPSRVSFEGVALITEAGSPRRSPSLKHALPHVLRLEDASHSAPTDGTATTIEKD